MRAGWHPLSLTALGLLSACSFNIGIPEQPQRGALSATIVFPDGTPVAGIDVVLTSESGEPIIQATDAQGFVEVTGLVPGITELTVTRTGHLTIVRSFQISAGKKREDGALTLVPLGDSSPVDATLNGKVVVAQGGDPAGAEVEFLVEGTLQQVAVVTLGHSGTFAQKLPPATYLLRASHPWYVTATMGGVVLAPREMKDLSSSPLSLAINPGTLKGKLLREDEVQGVLQAPKPADGALVTSDTGATGVVDAQGDWQLTGLPAGSRTLSVTLAGHHLAQPLAAIDLGPGETKTVADVQLALDRGDVTGTVVMGDGTEPKDITVSISGTPYNTGISPSATQPDRGTFRLAGIPIGTFEVVARRANYASASDPAVTVAFNQTRTTNTLTLARLQGDFNIDDGDTESLSGFTSHVAVTLKLSNAGNPSQYRASQGDPTFAGIMYQAYQSSSIPFMLSGGDGTKTVYLQFKDAMGTASGVLSSTIVLDRAAPTSGAVDLEDGKDFTSSKSTLLAQLTATDPKAMGVDAVSGLASVRVAPTSTLDAQGNLMAPSQTYQRDYSFQRPTTADGRQDVFVQFIDNAGNVSAVATDRVVIDTVPPTGSITVAQGAHAVVAGFTNTGLVDLDVTSTPEPNGGYLLLKLANETATDLSGAVLQPYRSRIGWFLDPTPGLRTVHYALVDAAGNSTKSSATITLDTTAPVVSALLLSPGMTNDAGVTLQLGVTEMNRADTQPVLTLSEDALFSGPTTTAASSWPASNQTTFKVSAGDGPKVVYVRVRDAAGNDGVASAALTLDQTPPTGSITVQGALADLTPSTTVTSTTSVSVLLSQSGASEFVLGNETLTTCPTSGYSALASSTLPWTLNGSATPREVRICLRDAAQNRAGPFADTLALDSAAPMGCALTVTGTTRQGAAAPAGLTGSAQVTATFGSCGETPTEMVLSTGMLNCASATLAWQPFNPSSTVQLVGGDGPYTVRACVRDAARNATAATAAMVTLDTTPPPVATASLVGSSPVGPPGSVTLALTATDPNGLSATQAVTVSEDPFFTGGGTVGPMAFPASSQAAFTLSAGDGNKTVYVRLRDALGNDAFAQVGVVLDTTPPTGSIVVQGALADLTPSTTSTSTTSVSVLLTQSGATGFLLGNEALVSCPSTAGSYAALSSSTLPWTLNGSATPREVRICLRDAAGNVAGPFRNTIVYDPSAPAGCTVALTGKKVDGSPAPAGKTASTTVLATVTCAASEGAVQMVLTNGIVTCSSSTSYPWVPLATNSSFVLSGSDGTNVAAGCVRDATGNVGSITSASIALDTTPPSAALLVLDNGAPYVNANQVGMRGGNYATAAGSASGAVTWALSENPLSFPAPMSIATSPFNFLFGGTGPRTLYAQFIDDVGNVSALASDSIDFDVTAPVTGGATMSITTPTANAFTNSVSVVVRLNSLPSDAAFVQLVQAASSGACALGDFSGAQSFGLASSYTFLLTPGDGLKRGCARVLDAAGNPSGFISATVTLDTLPPTQPVIVTPPKTFNPQGMLAFTVNTAGAVTEANFARYEQIGGSTNSWTNASAVIGTTAFPFTLVTSSTPEGLRNTLKLRAVDAAGNVGPEAQVIITTDTIAPPAIELNAQWVTNSSGSAVVYWRWPAAVTPPADLAGFKIWYGATNGNPGTPDTTYGGVYAVQGSSPVFVTGMSATLSGLTNGTLTYLTVRAVDAAGNVGPAPYFTGPSEVSLQPNTVSPNLVSTLTLSVPRIFRLAQYGTWVYALGTTFCSGTASTVLQPVDVSQLVSPVQGGVINASPPGPVAGTAITLADSLDCEYAGAYGPDMLIDGMFLYVVSNSKLRIYSLAVPSAPALLTTLDFSTTSSLVPAFPSTTGIVALALKGDVLFLAGHDPVPFSGSSYNTHVTALSLAKLFDSAAGTLPTLNADILGQVNGGFFVPNAQGITSLTVTRDRLVLASRNGAGLARCIDISEAVDNNPGTTFDQADVMAGACGFSFFAAHGSMPVGGNYYFMGGVDSFSVFDMNNLFAGGGGQLLPELTTVSSPGDAQNQVVGSQAFLSDPSGGGVRSLDLSRVNAIDDTGLYRFTSLGTPVATLVYGNYAFQGTNLGRFVTLEIASPRTPHTIASVDGVGPRSSVGAGLLYGSNGVAMDLTAGTPLQLNNEPGTFPSCNLDSATFEDLVVTTRGQQISLYNLQDSVDRSMATVFDGADTSTLTLPSGVIVTALERFGSFLVMAESRVAPAPVTGVWVEVLDLRKQLDDNAATNVAFLAAVDVNGRSSTDVVSALQVYATSSVDTWADLSLAHGRAAISIDDRVSPPPVGLVMVDLRNAFDDVAGGLVAASVQGQVNRVAAREVVVRGNLAYLSYQNGAMVGGVDIIDVTNAMDEDALTLVPANGTPVGNASVGGAHSLEVYGSWLMVYPIGAYANGMTTFDVSTPSAPKALGFFPYALQPAQCQPSGSTILRQMRTAINVRGSRAYMTTFNRLEVLELE